VRIHWLGVVYGLATAFLGMALVTLVAWLGLSLLSVDDPAVVGAVVGAPIGAVVGGFIGGRTSVRSVFHGGIVGVLFAGAVTVISVLDGSPASPLTMVGFLAAGAILAGFGGWLAERRRSRMGGTPVD
jgi:putative membrane protein (TIGR04086 family)